MMMSYEQSCRLCLTTITETGVDCSTIPEIYETVARLFEVQIRVNDNVRLICNGCFDYIMKYRAFKIKITECQKIIEDYENVRKKVIAHRFLKQEIVDVESYECNRKNSNTRRTPRPAAVTDSDINDILDLVHDTAAHRSNKPNCVKLEVDNPPCSGTKISSPSTQSLASRVSTTAEFVEEHVTTITEPTSTDANQLVGSNSTDQSLNMLCVTPPESQTVTSSLGSPVHEMKTASEKRARQSFTSSTESNKCTSTRNSTENSSSSQSEVINDIPLHVTGQKRRKLDNNISLSVKTKSMKDIPVNSSDSQTASTRRMTRQSANKSREPITTRSRKSNSVSPRSRSRAGKTTVTPNKSFTNPQTTSTPLPTEGKSQTLTKSMTSLNNSSTSTPPNHLITSSFETSSATSTSSSKRIITITLVRTKDSVSFRYCDENRRHIDFKTISSEELSEVRESLKVPKIWNNLREAFQSSPPDERTRDQLKAILGDEFSF